MPITIRASAAGALPQLAGIMNFLISILNYYELVPGPKQLLQHTCAAYLDTDGGSTRSASAFK